MASIEKFEDLKSWKEARQLCQLIHSKILTDDKIGDYALKNQINRSSGSIMDNIAEGFGRNGNKEVRQFLTIANGSCAEVKSQLHRAMDRNYISNEMYDLLINHYDNIGKLISGFIKYLNSSNIKGIKFKSQEEVQ